MVQIDTISRQLLTNIARAIRLKLGTEQTYTAYQMPLAIAEIPIDGGERIDIQTNATATHITDANANCTMSMLNVDIRSEVL